MLFNKLLFMWDAGGMYTVEMFVDNNCESLKIIVMASLLEVIIGVSRETRVYYIEFNIITHKGCYVTS